MKKSTEDWIWHLLYQVGSTYKGALALMLVAFFISLLIMSLIAIWK